MLLRTMNVTLFYIFYNIVSLHKERYKEGNNSWRFVQCNPASERYLERKKSGWRLELGSWTNMSWCCVKPFQLQLQLPPTTTTSSRFHSHVSGVTTSSLSLPPRSPLAFTHNPIFHFQPKQLKRASTTIRCSSGTIIPLSLSWVFI